MLAATVLRAVALCAAIPLIAVSCSVARGPKPRTATTLPRAMASAGDSLTRAFDVGPCCVSSDAPQYSWATGDNAAVNSHYRRLLKLNPQVRAFNYAKTGAKMADLERQVRGAASQRADYLTILIGANDVLPILKRDQNQCVARPAAMTSVATFRSEFEQALQTFAKLRPGARIFVSSVPDIRRLWVVLSRSAAARTALRTFGLCTASLKSETLARASRATSARVTAYNGVLASVCSAIARCRWDGGATYRYRFGLNDLSVVDYFHLSPKGQRHLAQLTWRASWWA